MNFWRCVQINIAENSSKSDVVLVFHPAAVTPAEHLHRYVVLTLAKNISNVEFVTVEGIFAIAHVIAVHPDVISGFHAFEMQTNALTIPLFGDCKCTAIMPDRVKVGRHIRRVHPISTSPRVSYIRINGMIITMHLPRARNRNFFPTANVIVIAEKFVVALARLVDMEKFPFARKCLIPLRTTAVAFHGLFYRSVGHHGGMSFKNVHRKFSRLAVPFIVWLRYSSRGRDEYPQNRYLV